MTNEKYHWQNLAFEAEDLFNKTQNYWKTWIEKLAIPTIYKNEVTRSALTLHLHVFNTGATIAAATTSLPEFLGSTRNWDYRFCWMRDSYYTLLAFDLLNNKEILQNYAHFLSLINEKYDERWPPLHTISLDRDPKELELNLPGYLNEKPVRIGNQAFEHIQNDIYGQVITTLLPYFINNNIPIETRMQFLPLIRNMLNMIQKTMDEPDNGLWEFRGLKQFHCYTYLFHWAGCKSALKIAEIFDDKTLFNLATTNLPMAIEKIERCFDEESGLYYQAIGSKNLDASLLQLITMHYLKSDNPRAIHLLSILEDKLSAENGLFYRYLHEDDFGKPDATFLICAFWHVEALAIMKNKDKAIANLNKILEYSNHLSLFSEDVHAKTGSQWGNFPQTYSHAGLIQAVNAIHNPNKIPLYL
jgi:GH15 family glucan-1,4-alpha-glucosidase